MVDFKMRRKAPFLLSIPPLAAMALWIAILVDPSLGSTEDTVWIYFVIIESSFLSAIAAGFMSAQLVRRKFGKKCIMLNAIALVVNGAGFLWNVWVSAGTNG